MHFKANKSNKINHHLWLVLGISRVLHETHPRAIISLTIQFAACVVAILNSGFKQEVQRELDNKLSSEQLNDYDRFQVVKCRSYSFTGDSRTDTSHNFVNIHISRLKYDHVSLQLVQLGIHYFSRYSLLSSGKNVACKNLNKVVRCVIHLLWSEYFIVLKVAVS